MKLIKLLILLLFSVFLISCGSGESQTSSTDPVSIKANEDDNNESTETPIAEEPPIETNTTDDNASLETHIEEELPIDESLIDTTKLYWPIDCTPGENCTIGHADIDGDGLAFDCSHPGYTGHEGIDINLMSWEQMDDGVDVYASQYGTVLWSFDDPSVFDRCTSHSTHTDCVPPSSENEPNLNEGYLVCTDLGYYCQKNSGLEECFWCFSGKNVIVIQHDNGPIFATRYDHLKSGSILVQKGDYVTRGQKIAEVGSAGNSTGPHLHFEVWGSDYYSPSEPFYGECGPNYTDGLWNYLNQPWKIGT